MAQTPASAPGQKLVQDTSGEYLTVADVMLEVARVPEANRARLLSNADAVQQIANSLLVRRLFAKEAVRDGLDKDAAVKVALQGAKDRVLSDALLEKIDKNSRPSDAVLEANARSAYQASGTRFDRAAQTHARHILIENKGPESLQKAKDLLAQLRAGASFDELAKTHSIDAGSAARGGDLGFFADGQMVRPFEDATKALQKPGDLSEPVESQFGLHIIRLEGRREKGRATFEEVRSGLIAEALVATINAARTAKGDAVGKNFTFDRAAIEALSKSASPAK
jgi:peptidyl-prolyl cis-trans isomerase C